MLSLPFIIFAGSVKIKRRIISFGEEVKAAKQGRGSTLVQPASERHIGTVAVPPQARTGCEIASPLA
ncbi:hypothetical protein [Sphingomonas sp. PP-CE-1G-424]|uniref:hypothetical protein n=1 Tax=Sphingomonas sp. PP-CE-1G-424 TaxID=2135658 RepID=UPI001054A304|nr:hypothetical protein [Sphingomonas sp. PP-CE-1G-424]